MARHLAQGDRVIATARDQMWRFRAWQAKLAPSRCLDAPPQSVSALAWQLDGESLDTAWYVAGVMDRADATQPPTRGFRPRDAQLTCSAMQYHPAGRAAGGGGAGRFLFVPA